MVYWDILAYTGIYCGILEYTGIYYCILEYTGIYCCILGYNGLYCDISSHVIQCCEMYLFLLSVFFLLQTYMYYTPHTSHTPPTHLPHTSQDFCSKGLAVDMRTSRLIVKALIRSSRVVTIVLDDTSIRKIK